MACPTIHDSTRTPKGKHALYVYHFEPYNLKQGGAAAWDDIKEDACNSLLETLQKQTTNMGSENILGKWAMTPLDYERYNPSWINGDFTHSGMYVYQNLGNRPLPGWAQYRTPIKGLYICGASTHPGMGVIGAGRAAVQVIMEDLGIDFEDVVSK